MQRPEQFIASMSIKEKIGQLVQFGKLKEEQDTLVKNGEIGSFLNIHGAEKINPLQQKIMQSKNPVPLIIGDDVIHGYKTIFPIPLALSCSWNIRLIEKTCEISSYEAASEGINMIFAPMVDIARDPRWGRIAEGSGEDPFLGSEIAKARVRGIQKNANPNLPKVTACVKHFISYGAAEGGRDYNTTDMSERTMREVYLPPFRAALEEGAGSLMVAFNDFNGTPVSINSFLITRLLRQELNFEGVTVSDWESIEECINHGVAVDRKDAAMKGLSAGVDIDMNSGVYLENLESIITQNPDLEEKLDQAVLRILRLKEKLGLFDSFITDPSAHLKEIRKDEYVQTARQAAVESIVLLKNNGILPLKRNKKKIAVIGPLAEDTCSPLGCWPCKGNPDNVVSFLKAFQKNPEYDILFEKGCEINSEDPASSVRAESIASQSDLVIAVMGESNNMSGENNNRSSIELPKPQRELLKKIYTINKNIILVVMSGRPIALEWEDEHMAAVLQAWHLGDESGNAINEILTGLAVPNAKLTVTVPRSTGQIPMYYNHKNTGRPSFRHYIDVADSELYPFGFGMSYTSFEYSNLRTDKKVLQEGESVTLKVDIKNTGKLQAYEICQIYMHDPVSEFSRPVKQLVAFKKISILPGETQTLSFTFSTDTFAVLNSQYLPTVEKGTIELFAGTNSRDLIKTTIEIL